MAPLSPRYGGDWNPEQWDDATVDEDIRLMQEAGVNLVSLGIFSWAFLEPREGTYDFDWIIRIMDKCAAAGIAVDLATGTASPPAWMARNHPETLPIDRDGRTLQFGSRQQFSPANPYVRRKAADLARALATAVKGHDALVMWHISNEFGNEVAESFDDISLAEFRSWLAQRYPSIDDLNDAWGTAFWSQRYSSFEEVGPPAPLPTFHNPGHLFDWRQFFSDQLLACYEAEARALREVTPDIPITTNFMGFFPTTDYWTWAEGVDIVTDDSYPDPASPFSAHQVACTGDLMRSLGGNRPFLLMEQTTNAVQWREFNTSKRPGQFHLWSLQRVGHGADGILQFQWRQSRAGSETFHSAMVPHAGTDTPLWRDVCALGEELAKLGPVLGKVPTNRIGVVLDWKAQWACEALLTRGPIDHFAQVGQWHRTWWEAGYGVDILPVDANFAPYDVVILPALVRLPNDGTDLAARVREAAAAGTQVFLAGPTGHTDGRLHAFLGGYGGPLAEAAGVFVHDHFCPAPTLTYPWSGEQVRPRLDRISGAVGTPGAYPTIEMSVAADHALGQIAQAAGLDDHWCTGDGWADLMRPHEDVEVVARWGKRGALADYQGDPAITYRAFPPAADGRQGGIWWIGTQLGAPARAAFAARAAQLARLTPTGGKMWPAGIECVERGDCVFFLNHSDREITLASVADGHTLLAGAGTLTGVDLVVPPRSGAVLQATGT